MATKSVNLLSSEQDALSVDMDKLRQSLFSPKGGPESQVNGRSRPLAHMPKDSQDSGISSKKDVDKRKK